MTAEKERITPTGYATLQAELVQLWEKERPQVVRTVHWAAGNGDRSENGDYIYGKKRLREIDRRVRYLRKRLEILTVVDARFQADRGRVHFGATVRFERENGRVQTVTIVGSDETDANVGRISADSPIGRALLGQGHDGFAEVQTPCGEDELHILAISYPDQDA